MNGEVDKPIGLSPQDEKRMSMLITNKYNGQLKKSVERGIIPMTRDDIRVIFIKTWNAGFTCSYCNRKLNLYAVAGMWNIARATSLDHIKPTRRGGTNDRNNLQIICHQCNMVKNSTDPVQFDIILKALRERGGDIEVWKYLDEQYPIAFGQSLPRFVGRTKTKSSVNQTNLISFGAT